MGLILQNEMFEKAERRREERGSTGAAELPADTPLLQMLGGQSSSCLKAENRFYRRVLLLICLSDFKLLIYILSCIVLHFAMPLEFSLLTDLQSL